MKHPRNETEIHAKLKEIAKYILWGWGYCIIGTEVGGMHAIDLPQRKGMHMKNIIDVVGLKEKNRKYYDCKGIEAKATLADYKNGFCAAPAYSYIIAPCGVIPLDQIPDAVGLIEVDFNTLRVEKNKYRIPDMAGVTLVRGAKKRIDKRFQSEESYREWCASLLKRIAYRTTQELLFWGNKLNIEGLHDEF